MATSANPARRQQFNPGEEIKQLILERGLAPGEALPTETELMSELGISRGSLREALKGLQARGIIEVQHGRGTFVAQPTMDSLVDGLIFRGRLDYQHNTLTTASDLVDIRDILESALVRQVAAEASAELVAALEPIVAEMEDAAARGGQFQAADRRFHETLYSSLGNALVIQLLGAFWDVLEAVRPQLASGLSEPVADARHHRRILEHVRDGDPDAAGRAMSEHFQATHRWIQGRGGRPAECAKRSGSSA